MPSIRHLDQIGHQVKRASERSAEQLSLGHQRIVVLLSRVYGCGDLCHFTWLVQELKDLASVDRVDGSFQILVSCQHHEHCLRHLFAKMPYRFNAVHFWHLHVTNDN